MKKGKPIQIFSKFFKNELYEQTIKEHLIEENKFKMSILAGAHKDLWLNNIEDQPNEVFLVKLLNHF